VQGGHLDEIVCVQYSAELSLIATGTISGEIALWDYEYSRLMSYCVGHDNEITSLNFIWPYPVLLSTSVDCQVILWRVRAVAEENTNVKYSQCLYRFVNLSFQISLGKVVPAPISTCQIRQGVFKGMEREKKD